MVSVAPGLTVKVPGPAVVPVRLSEVDNVRELVTASVPEMASDPLDVEF
jgi:hypothetical protein